MKMKMDIWRWNTESVHRLDKKKGGRPI